MLFSFPKQTINGFTIPAFTVSEGDLVFIEVGGGERFMTTIDAIKEVLTGRNINKSAGASALFTYVPHTRQTGFSNRLFSMSVGRYLERYANPESVFYEKIYETPWVKPQTKLDDMRGSLHRRLLSLYTTLSWTNRIVLDIAGMDYESANQLVAQVKQMTDNGGAAVLIDFAPEFKKFSTQHIIATPEAMGNWRHKETFAIGGLQNIGYVPGADLLLVLSSQGEGIFDCISGDKIAKLHNDEEWWDDFDESNGTIKGFDFLENITIPTSGLYGDDLLPKTTADGWSLEIAGPAPDDPPFAKHNVHRIYLVSPDKKHRTFIAKDGACELRAYGFSGTGNSFVIAHSCNLYIYNRL